MQLSAAEYTAVRSRLTAHVLLLERYRLEALVRVEQREAKAAAIVAKLNSLAAGQEAERDRLAKHVAFLHSQIAEARSADAAAASLNGSVAALPAAPTAGETAASLGTYVSSCGTLLGSVFKLAQVAASKALGMCVCSAFEASPWSLGALYFGTRVGRVSQSLLVYFTHIGLYP